MNLSPCFQRAPRCASLAALAMSIVLLFAALPADFPQGSVVRADVRAGDGGGILYVDVAGPVSGDGLSWASAFRRLQDALAVAAGSGGAITEIWVATGTYIPTDRSCTSSPQCDGPGGGTCSDDVNGICMWNSPRAQTFQLLDGVALYGGFAGDETGLSQRNIAANPTILSGDINGDDASGGCSQDSPDCDSNGALCGDDGFCIIKDNNTENSYHVVTGTGTGATARIDGFIITGGNANGGNPDRVGGGLLNEPGSPTVANCTFRGNRSFWSGGAMRNGAGSAPTVTTCTFTGNAGGTSGGGMVNEVGSSPTVANCDFMGNSANTFGGGMNNFNDSSPVVSDCTFRENFAASQGGGMHNSSNSHPTVTNSTFIANSANNNGGGMYNLNASSPAVTNCMFRDNVAGADGGGMWNLNSSSPTVVNCTFSGNTAALSGGGIFNDGDSSPTVSNSILWQNNDSSGTGEAAQIHTVTGDPVVNYGIVQGGWSGTGGVAVLNSDPIFADADLRLSSGSPAIDAADNDAVPPDVADLDGDADTAELTPFDLDHSSRFFDIPGQPDTGESGATGLPVVDMGAYEFHVATLRLQPVSATGDFSISGNEIQIAPGETVTLELQLLGWDPELLQGYQARIDASGYTSGMSGTLTLLADPDASAGAFIDTARLEFVFFNQVVLTNVDVETYSYSAVVFPGGEAVDPGVPRYAGTLKLVASTNASGTFAVGFDPDTLETFLLDETSTEITPLVLTPAVISIPETGIRYVDANVVGGAQDGRSWEHAYVFLQDALAEAAASGGIITEIWVADGAYKPDQGGGQTPGDRTATFQLLNGVAIYGGFAGGETTLDQRDIAANETILSGDLDADDVDVACIVDSPDCDSFGGLCLDGSCIISNNNAENSYHVVTASGTEDTALLDGFTFTGGNADGAGADEGGGAGLLIEGGDPRVNRCTFLRNAAVAQGGGILVAGVGLVVTNSTFRGNSAFEGGGINVVGSEVAATNCLFVGNTATGHGGGGMFIQDAVEVALTNCTFGENVAMGAPGGGVMYEIPAGVTTITNSVLWGNLGSAGSAEVQQIAGDGPIIVNYSIVQGGWSGAGVEVLDSDPLFADPDLRLSSGSPAIDAGDNDAVPLGIVTDLDGHPRFVNDVDTLDTGNGTAPIVDMGAYESQGVPVIFVDAAAAGANDGTSWADAYNNLQDGLAAANTMAAASTARVATGPGITTYIWVARGTYMPDGGYTPPGGPHVGGSGDDDAMFQLLNGVILYGGFAGTETDLAQRDVAANETILSGDLFGNDADHACPGGDADCASNGDLCVDGICILADNMDENSRRSVVTGTGTDGTAVLNGFTITAAGGTFDAGGMRNIDELPTNIASPTVRNCTLTGNAGGGVTNFGTNASPTVTNCVFEGNAAEEGGAIANYGGSPTITNCAFRNNIATFFGGAIQDEGFDIKVSHCVFIGNRATFSSGAMRIGTGAATVSNCMFIGNSAPGDPQGANGSGGALSFSGASPTITNCTFIGNGASGGGGGINMQGASPMLSNCTFVANSTGGSGGAIGFSLDSSPTLTNCTMAGNSADRNGGALIAGNSGLNDATLANCILWGNVDDADGDTGGPFTDESAQFHVFSGAPVVNFSIVQGGWSGAGGIGNSASDPLFVDVDGPDNISGTEDDDVRVSAGSPAIDAGDNTALPADVADLDGDLDTTEEIPFDLDNEPRRVDVPATVDTGNGTAPVVDMGAYEHQPPPCLASSAPQQASLFTTGQDDVKGRFVSVTAGDPGQNQTVRVTWDVMPNWPTGHNGLVGQQKFMMQPYQVCENSGQGLAVSPPDCGPSPGQPQRWLWAANLTCDPNIAWFGDLASLTNHCTGSGEACVSDADCAAGTCGVDGAIHLVDGGIAPSRVSGGVTQDVARYKLQAVDEACSLDLEASYSAALSVDNAGWGDLTGTPGSCPASVPNRSVDLVGDVTEAIRKFSNEACAPKKTRVDMDQDFVINFATDVQGLVDAFSAGGGGFDETAPAVCAAGRKRTSHLFRR